MNFPTDDDEVMFLVTFAAVEVVASAITDPPPLMALPNTPSNCSRGYIAIWPTRRAAVAACGNAPKKSMAKGSKRLRKCIPCQSCRVQVSQESQVNRGLFAVGMARGR